MLGDPHTLLRRDRVSDKALYWAGKIMLVVRNKRNTVKVMIILDDDKPHAWPNGMTKEEVREILSQVKIE